MGDKIALLNDFIMWIKEHDILDITEEHDGGSEFYPTNRSGDDLIAEYMNQTTKQDREQLKLF